MSKSRYMIVVATLLMGARVGALQVTCDDPNESAVLSAELQECRKKADAARLEDANVRSFFSTMVNLEQGYSATLASTRATILRDAISVRMQLRSTYRINEGMTQTQREQVCANRQQAFRQWKAAKRQAFETIVKYRMNSLRSSIETWGAAGGAFDRSGHVASLKLALGPDEERFRLPELADVSCK